MCNLNNIFYFRKICAIGGTEQFLYEIAKKYKNYDITIFYDEGDPEQLYRLRKYVRCIKHKPGEKVQCKRAFFNFNLDMINDVEAEQYYFISHANYEELHKVHGGYIPPIKNEKLTHYIGVSQFATDKLNEYAEKIGSRIRAKRCYNPLTLEPKEKVLHLVSAGRLDDEVKGGKRTLKLIEALDNYCERTGRHYVWSIFTNPTNKINTISKNVAIMKPRTDVRPYIADADYVLQLSNDMETYCYTINEALGYGVPIVTTPLSILKELPITDNEHILLDWNCENVEEVARQIFEKKVEKFEYNPPKDNWEEYIIKAKSKYEEEKKMKYLVEATEKYEITNTSDNDLSARKGTRYVPKPGEQWEVECDRKDKLLDLGFIKVVKALEEKKAEVKKEKKKEIETAAKKPKAEKAVKKTTKKSK